MRLIDADALKKLISNEIEAHDADVCKSVLKTVLSYINAEPTIDAVPVEEIAGIFGNPPCMYTFDCLEVQGDEFMYDHRGEWCEKNCMHVPCVDCWKQFFEAWRERKNDE